jgi:hypothetical protein
MGGDGADFFVSHAGADRAWAEWAAWQLKQAGYAVELDVWDWAAGQNFIAAISDALDRCDRVVALFSAAYFDRSRYTTEEWATSLLHAPGTAGRLIPVRIEDVPAAQMPAVLRPLLYRDLFGLAADQARRVLLEAVAGPGRPGEEPAFPGAAGAPAPPAGPGPRLPGSVPPVWNIPARNQQFTGRDGLLVAVRERLLGGDRAVVQALHGMGGVGKTQLAAEYAHQFAGTYDLAWWIDAEQAALIGQQFAALGTALGVTGPGAGIDSVQPAVLAGLRQRDRWLLVFDNAQHPGDVAAWLPGGSTGHVLITTRASGWQEIAGPPVEVDVFARTESLAILHDRVPGLTGAGADALAAELGDLPLAIAQAAGYMADSQIPADEYLDLLRTRTAHVLGEGQPPSYPRPLAAAIQLTMQQLTTGHPAAAMVAHLSAFLAPEPIPLALFTTTTTLLPGPLAAAAADPLAWRNLLTVLGRTALARASQHTVQMHRLTQAILRDQLPGHDAAATRDLAAALLAASHPGDPSDPATWPAWAGLLPHILATDPATSSSPAARKLAADAAHYLLQRGDIRAAFDLAQSLHQHWEHRLGPGHPDTLTAAHRLAHAHTQQGHYQQARQLDETTLARRRRVLGDDHPDTLQSAHSLAAGLANLGEYQAARDQYAALLPVIERIFGAEHPLTLITRGALAYYTGETGDPAAARDQSAALVPVMERVLGAEHPETLDSRRDLARWTGEAGDPAAARDQSAALLPVIERVLGPEHPKTLAARGDLAYWTGAAGDPAAARDQYAALLPVIERISGAEHPLTLITRSDLARWTGEAGDPAAARGQYAALLPVMERVLGPEHPKTLAARSSLIAP